MWCSWWVCARSVVSPDPLLVPSPPHPAPFLPICPFVTISDTPRCPPPVTHSSPPPRRPSPVPVPTRCSALLRIYPLPRHLLCASFHAQRFVSRTWGTRISTSISQITRHRRCGKRTTSFGNFTRRWVEEEELLNVTSASLALHCLDSLLSL